ncbi:MAG: hypothetical protein DRI94_00860 [Bacteroidetes bacterium]|nr:MAG: hypothetical protein DRI94_00860 [Bacteroidota bacterium]
MKKQIIVILSFVFIFAFNSTSLFAQGCEDGGGEEGVQLKGFIQPQYVFSMNGNDANGNSLNENTFNFNRTRLGVVGSIPYDFSYYFFTEISPFKNTTGQAVQILDAFVTYSRLGTWAKFSFGLFKSPISLEQNTSCSGLSTINRSDVVGQLAGPQRDMGLMLLGGNDTTLVKYSVAVMNGVGKFDADDNKGKDIVGRLIIHPIEFLEIGGSYRYGNRNPTDLSQKQNDIMRFGGELKFDYKGFVIQGEYLHGQDKLYSTTRIPIYGGCGGIVGFDTKTEGTYYKNGYWVMASYRTKWDIEPVIKYDAFDPDLDISNDWKNNLTFGINYFFNDWTRLQINYIKINEATPVDNDLLMVQIQVKF